MDLWGVVLGGLIATISASLVPSIQHYWGSKSKNEEDRKAALRHLIRTSYEHGEWLQKRTQNLLFSGGHPYEPDPLADLATLIYVDFPDNRAALHKLEVAAARYEQWLVARQKEKLNNTPMDMSEYTAIYRGYTRARDNVVREALGLMPLADDNFEDA